MAKDGAWGGQIELMVLSKVCGLEIATVDIQTGRADVYGAGSSAKRCFLLYSGEHYDPLVVSAGDDAASEGTDETEFDASDAARMASLQGEASALAESLRARRQFYDGARGGIQCAVCEMRLIGEDSAREHAARTGHTNFRSV